MDYIRLHLSQFLPFSLDKSEFRELKLIGRSEVGIECGTEIEESITSPCSAYNDGFDLSVFGTPVTSMLVVGELKEPSTYHSQIN